jgi:hypothetical protein
MTSLSNRLTTGACRKGCAFVKLDLGHHPLTAEDFDTKELLPPRGD